MGGWTVRPVALSFTGDIGGRNSDILNFFIRFYLLNLQALIFMNQVIGFQCYKVRYNNRDTCVFVLNEDM